MKKIIASLCALLLPLLAFAQNDKADSIIGTFLCGKGQSAYKVKIVKLTDGTYKGSICWVADPYDENGKIATDTKNPKKELRNTPMDKVVLFKGLQYDAEKQHWTGTKIYDPNRGINVKMTAKFEKPGTLVVRGTVLGIGESVNWIKQD